MKNPFPSWITHPSTPCHLKQTYLDHGTSLKSIQAAPLSTKSTANHLMILSIAHQQTRTNVDSPKIPHLQIRANHDSRHTRKHHFSRTWSRAIISLGLFIAVFLPSQNSGETCDRALGAIYKRFGAWLHPDHHKENPPLCSDPSKLSVFVTLSALLQQFQSRGILSFPLVSFSVYVCLINLLCIFQSILPSLSAWKSPPAPLPSLPFPLFSPTILLCNPPTPFFAEIGFRTPSAPPAVRSLNIICVPFSAYHLPRVRLPSSCRLNQCLRSISVLMAEQPNQQAPQVPNINIDGLFGKDCTMCKTHTFMINRLRSQITDLKEDHASDSRSKRKKLEKHKEEIKNLKDRCSHLEDLMEQLKVITQGSHAEASTKVSGAQKEPIPDFSLTQKTPYEL